MKNQQSTDTTDRDHLVAALQELIDALDRRVPRVERAGELGIARDAAALRNEALTRIEQLKHVAQDPQGRDPAQA